MTPEEIAEEIERSEFRIVPINELKPNPKNPRRNEIAANQLVETISAVGYGAPILVQKSTGQIIAGHTRLKAAKKQGLKKLPCYILDIDDRRAQAMALADNRVGEIAEWDFAGLAEQLSDYSLEQAEALGFDSKYLENLADQVADFGPLASEAVEEDELPEDVAKARCKIGDTWILGRHRLLCGDARRLTDRKYGMVVTDPPYGISVVKNGMVGADFGGGGPPKGKYAEVIGDDKPAEVAWMLDLAPKAIIWGGNYFANQLPCTGSWLIWDKREDIGVVNSFADAELAWSNCGGPARIHRQLWLGMVRKGEHQKRVHPTQKPVALMAWCLGFGDGDVCDPFLGSGTTLIAAEQTNRTCYGAELSPAYCDVIIERWQNLTGQKAEKA